MEEEFPINPQKILRSSQLNNKTSVTCTKVPEGLFDSKIVDKHFSKFGKVVGIKLLPKKQMCIVEYDQQSSAERAVLNAGAFDGFMFDVTRTKPRVRRKSKKDDDPEWLPDSEVEEELNAMNGAPTYRLSRQKTMDVDTTNVQSKINKSPIRKKTLTTTPKRVKQVVQKQPTSGIESPVIVTTAATSLSIIEAAAELHKLRSRISTTPDEKWRTLDARDRILRAWGGAGSRVKVGGATIGTCPDMCPEKELLHRQAEHQVMTLETIIDSDGLLEPWRAVKQYSRSSADQEIPMCYELRPATVLMRTCAYLLHEIADTNRQVTLADWFHFMWDRFRGIRKDITQQALCCAESIRMVEICARFHAHSAARLADLEHTQFDQKLNTDNLTKCLQTLKHMYADISSEFKPNEAEFRGYVALLNLGDANFWWEIKQLPQNIQKSESIIFAIQIYTALDSNNYVKFFRLVRERATYLQACILLRYFNDVRARALARIVKAAPRGGSKYPAETLLNILSFESMEAMKSFINHYGVRFAKNQEEELAIILNRNVFIEDSDPFPLSRAINTIESKRKSTVGEVISGGILPQYEYTKYPSYTSFNQDGRLKESALTAEDVGYDTKNDSYKDVAALRLELQKLVQGKSFGIIERSQEPKKPVVPSSMPEVSHKRNTGMGLFSKPISDTSQTKLFQFQPAIQVAPVEAIDNSLEKVLEESRKDIFTFSNPQKTESNIFSANLRGNLFSTTTGAQFASESNKKQNIFSKEIEANRNSKPPTNLFKMDDKNDVFKNSTTAINNSVFGQSSGNRQDDKKIFVGSNTNIFAKSDGVNSNNLFTQSSGSLFKNSTESSESTSIFGKPAQPSNPIGLFGKPQTRPESIFGSKSEINTLPSYESHQNHNGKLEATSPGSLFKNANQPSDIKYNIFQSKNKIPSVADNIFNSVNAPKRIYDFDSNDGVSTENISQVDEQSILEEQKRRQQEKEIQEKLKEQQRMEEAKRAEEIKRIEELKKLEEKRKKEEEKKQEELKKKLEQEKLIELKRKAEEERKLEIKRKQEEERLYKQRVDNESVELVHQLLNEISNEETKNIFKDESDLLNSLVKYAIKTNEEICAEVIMDMCNSEVKAIIFRRQKIMERWYRVWRQHYMRNNKRRSLLEDTPVWLPDKTCQEKASYLHRSIEEAALQNMNAIHRGYKFTGELKFAPSPKPYNLLDIIRSPLLKRMKQIEYPYDKCFFWKLALVSPGTNKYLHRKVNVENWLCDVFSDKKPHNVSNSLIYVDKHSWNNLMDFALSVSLVNQNKMNIANEALNGANGLIFYVTEKDNNYMNTIEQILKHKYKYQIIPIAVVVAVINNDAFHLKYLNEKLMAYKNNEIISNYKIFYVKRPNVEDLLNTCTKNAIKWLAKNYPKPPPLEIDNLKSICQRYLGNEIWCGLKSQNDPRTDAILKDLPKLVMCYNRAVDELTAAITNEDLFNYASFPLEFTKYLDSSSPYPKPYEFITSNVKQSDNTSAIKLIMQKLKLPSPESGFLLNSETNMKNEIRKYCKQISWFSNPDHVACKVVALLPKEVSDVNMSFHEFYESFEGYDLTDLLNVIVYEKINSLNNFENRYAMYKKSVLDEYCNISWMYELDVYYKSKHKAVEYEDDMDYLIKAKRRKIEFDSMEHLMLEDKDYTIVEENINNAEQSISAYNSCKDAMSQLEIKLDEEKKKSEELENLLRLALSNV